MCQARARGFAACTNNHPSSTRFVYVLDRLISLNSAQRQPPAGQLVSGVNAYMSCGLLAPELPVLGMIICVSGEAAHTGLAHCASAADWCSSRLR